MLRVAKVAGTEGFWSSDDCLLVCTFGARREPRRRFVMIAPKRRFLGVKGDDPRKNYRNQSNGEGWHFMGVSKEDGTPGYYGLSLELAHPGRSARGREGKAWF